MKFIRVTYLLVLLLPGTLFYFGVACNQLVLVMNHDRFPVMWNSYKANKLALEISKATQSDKPDVAEQAQFDEIALEEYGYLDDTHVLMSKQTKLNWLADWIDLHAITLSPGDVLVFSSEYLSGFAPFLWGCLLCRKVYALEK